jgi:hypothetical protein
MGLDESNPENVPQFQLVPKVAGTYRTHEGRLQVWDEAAGVWYECEGEEPTH